ncbi:hypothetical protein EYF80_039070 [Liparis tanakae]|uniref:Uncharacterized protein n=1 Tax=Liparis tanakae TaxID=230148 RepID=A0A4Z2GBK5_9TELE|nr:hypothetical protein EYF80_039070 [Liparis tanakae]
MSLSLRGGLSLSLQQPAEKSPRNGLRDRKTEDRARSIQTVDPPRSARVKVPIKEKHLHLRPDAPHLRSRSGEPNWKTTSGVNPFSLSERYRRHLNAPRSESPAA